MTHGPLEACDPARTISLIPRQTDKIARYLRAIGQPRLVDYFLRRNYNAKQQQCPADDVPTDVASPFLMLSRLRRTVAQLKSSHPQPSEHLDGDEEVVEEERESRFAATVDEQAAKTLIQLAESCRAGKPLLLSRGHRLQFVNSLLLLLFLSSFVYVCIGEFFSAGWGRSIHNTLNAASKIGKESQ